MKGLICFVAFCLFVLSANAYAEPGMIGTSDRSAILRIAKSFGTAEWETTSKGTPVIMGRMEGQKYLVMLSGCNQDNEECSGLLLASVWSGKKGGVSTADVNRWNAKTKAGKVYLDSDSDPVLEMYIPLKYGVTKKYLEDFIDWFKIAIISFKKDVIEK